MNLDKPHIVCEISGNHNGCLGRAIRMIKQAKEAGADSIKIQTYKPFELCDPANNHIYEKSQTPRDWYPALFDCANRLAIPLFSSVFSADAVAFLENFNCPIYKIASPESTRLPVSTYIAIARAVRATRKPLMISSGRKDLGMALGLAPEYLLFCVAGYPATVTDDDLDFFSSIREWPKEIGFSDHTDGMMVPLAMIGAGAKIIEKHFKLDDDCEDAAFAFNPDQFAQLCTLAHR